MGGASFRGVCSRGVCFLPEGCLLPGVGVPPPGGDVPGGDPLPHGTATAVGGTHPTGMHSCIIIRLNKMHEYHVSHLQMTIAICALRGCVYEKSK